MTLQVVTLTVNGETFTVYTADEAAAQQLSEQVRAAARSGETLDVMLTDVRDGQVVPLRVLTIRFAAVATLQVDSAPAPFSGGAIGISR
jgi:hypothetical protein